MEKEQIVDRKSCSAKPGFIQNLITAYPKTYPQLYAGFQQGVVFPFFHLLRFFYLFNIRLYI